MLFGVAKTQSGTPVPSGTLIEARIGNGNHAQTITHSTGIGSQDTRTHSLTGGDLNYGTSAAFQICGDDSPTEAVEEGAEGDQIVFYVVGIQAAAQPSTVFLVDGSLRVDLTIPSLTAPTGIPAAPSTSACTVTRALSAPTPHRDGRLYAYGNTDGALCTDSRSDSKDDCVGPRGSGGGAGHADCTGRAS